LHEKENTSGSGLAPHYEKEKKHHDGGRQWNEQSNPQSTSVG
jgi:hypothetical protein